jgi:heat shock protein HslJ
LNFTFSLLRSLVLACVSFAAGCACAQSAVLQASGYNPGWTLEIGGNTATFSAGLQLPVPPPKVVGAIGAPKVTATSRFYTAQTNGGVLAATFSKLTCTDAQSAVVRPDTVQVRFGGADYQGCGGDPLSLLQGKEWVVEDIAARGVLDRSHISMQFGADATLRGRASCNPYEGSYAYTDGTLHIRATANPSVVKARPEVNPGAAPQICPPALRRQDAAFFEVLGAITRWDFTSDDALALGTVDGRRIVARRQLSSP